MFEPVISIIASAPAGKEDGVIEEIAGVGRLPYEYVTGVADCRIWEL
jgi:hypothetical protein